MNAPDPIADLAKSDHPADPLLIAILNRLIRIETRLVRLMLYHNVNPAPDSKESGT